MTKKKRITRVVLITGIILLLPLLAMQFTDQVVWSVSDFIIAGVLLLGAGFTYELVGRKVHSTTYRAAIGLSIATVLFLVWMNLAVGLLGDENNPANLMYIGVLAVGLVGTLIARFRPREMSHALFATALAQALVPLIALCIWQPLITFDVFGELILNAFFVVMFIVSGLLFRRAAHTEI